MPLLVVAVTAALGLKAVSGALTLLETYLNIGVRQRILLALKSSLFQHLQRLSLTFHDNRRLGDSIHRVNNDAYCVEDFVASALHLLTAFCTLVGMLWIVFKIDWQLALVAAAASSRYLYWCVDLYFKRFNPKIHQVQQMEAESTSIVQETLSNLRVVKAFAREDYEHDRFLAQGHSTVMARIG